MKSLCRLEGLVDPYGFPVYILIAYMFPIWISFPELWLPDR